MGGFGAGWHVLGVIHHWILWMNRRGRRHETAYGSRGKSLQSSANSALRKFQVYEWTEKAHRVPITHPLRLINTNFMTVIARGIIRCREIPGPALPPSGREDHNWASQTSFRLDYFSQYYSCRAYATSAIVLIISTLSDQWPKSTIFIDIFLAKMATLLLVVSRNK